MFRSWFLNSLPRVIQSNAGKETTLFATATPFTPKEILSSETQDLIQQMKQVMKKEDGCGLAAPQIGVSKRLFVCGFEGQDDLPDISPLPFQAIFNPIINKKSQTTFLNAEACLSVHEGHLMGIVKRHLEISMTFLDEHANERRIEANGVIAGILQHEFDHLNGVLFISRNPIFNFDGDNYLLKGSFSLH